MNDPANPSASRLSPYLHFGQISPVEVAHKVQSTKGAAMRDREAFLEELVVRRELAMNFVEFEEHYDSFRCLPDWARKTLSEHIEDHRPDRYTAKQLERAETRDRYWNAAMNEMKAFLNEFDDSTSDAMLDRAATVSADVIAHPDTQARLRELFG